MKTWCTEPASAHQAAPPPTAAAQPRRAPERPQSSNPYFQAVGSAEAEVGEESNLFVGAVRQLSPGLADVIEHGFVGAFQDDVTEATESWLAEAVGDIHIDTFAGDVAAAIGGPAGMFVGAALGDQTCCDAFGNWLAAFSRGAEDFVRSDSLLALLSSGVEELFSTILAALGRLIDRTGIVQIIGSVVDFVTGTVQQLLDGLRAINQDLGDRVADFLGVSRSPNGLTGLVQEQFAALVECISQQIRAFVDEVLAVIFSIPFVDDLHAVVDFALEMRDGVAWLWEHWGDDDLWEQAAALESRLPVFASLLLGGKATWDGIRAAVVASARTLIAGIDGVTTAMVGLPLASIVVAVHLVYIDAIRAIVESPVWGEISEALSVAWEFGPR